MICRIWRGWTTPDKAAAYEAVVRGTVIPGIEARPIPGFRHIDLPRQNNGKEVKSPPLMGFDAPAAVKRFIGKDYSVSHAPAEARAVLARFDARAAHAEVLDRRPQGEIVGDA